VSEPLDSPKGRLPTAGAVAALSASVAYVIANLYERVVAGEPDPFLIVRDIHFGYYHRAALAAWLGVAGGMVAFRLLVTPAEVERVQRWVGGTTLPLVVALGALAYLFP
jgi:hypothetical protein